MILDLAAKLRSICQKGTEIFICFQPDGKTSLTLRNGKRVFRHEFEDSILFIGANSLPGGAEKMLEERCRQMAAAMKQTEGDYGS